MTLLRGRRQGLEVVLAGRDLAEAFEELEARLAERPSFYRGASATANFGMLQPSPDDLARLRALLSGAGIQLRALAGDPMLEAVARGEGLDFEVSSSGGELARRRALRPRGQVALSESARSLVADFAGARYDIAERRKRGEASVPRLATPVPVGEKPLGAGEKPALSLVEGPPGALYHAGTLRGGQALHHNGHIVVVGDVNPGAELIAVGDIVVFGRLAGIAHAGAQGDEDARIYAIDLAATQLRVATFIAADSDASAPAGRGPEAAVIRDGRIVILSMDRLDRFDRQGATHV